QALPSPRPRITAADRAQTPSRPAGTQSMPLARTPKGRAFTAASTPAGLIPRGEPPDPTQCPFSNRWFLTSLSPLLTDLARSSSEGETVYGVRDPSRGGNRLAKQSEWPAPLPRTIR